MTFKTLTLTLALATVTLVAMPTTAQARVKLVALPERADTVIRLDNPNATLIEEERVLTLQAGENHVDFSWNGVQIDSDSIRLTVLDHVDQVNLLNVSYPPNEQALVWEISAGEAAEVKVRISYLLRYIDRLVTYKGTADKEETKIDLKSYLVLRNFSGEDFTRAHVQLDYGEAFDQGILHEETKQLLFFRKPGVPIEKVWRFDARNMQWDPEKVDTNVGIPVSYRIKNDAASQLGENALWGGKVRMYQDDGHASTIFLGEDMAGLTPVGEKMELRLGDSRDIVVTQRKMIDRQINQRKNNQGNVILYDTDELITAKIENFKDKPAVLTMVQQIDGQWDMEECTHEYVNKDYRTLEFEIKLEPKQTVNFSMHYHRRNIR